MVPRLFSWFFLENYNVSTWNSRYTFWMAKIIIDILNTTNVSTRVSIRVRSTCPRVRIQIQKMQGLYSLRIRRLISIGIPIINMRRSSDHLRFIMGITIPVRRRLVNRGPVSEKFERYLLLKRVQKNTLSNLYTHLQGCWKRFHIVDCKWDNDHHLGPGWEISHFSPRTPFRYNYESMLIPARESDYIQIEITFKFPNFNRYSISIW